MDGEPFVLSKLSQHHIFLKFQFASTFVKRIFISLLESFKAGTNIDDKFAHIVDKNIIVKKIEQIIAITDKLIIEVINLKTRNIPGDCLWPLLRKII